MRSKQTFSPEEAQVIRDAFVLARKTFGRTLTKNENARLAQVLMELAGGGCTGADRLSTRAVIRIIC